MLAPAVPTVERLMRLDERNLIDPPKVTNIHRFFFTMISSENRPEPIEEMEKGLRS